jgi:outer membrane protein OmpA-like peptidoglycan-associated protein/tetratricopeptide (TPR) repeat protein
MAVLFCAQLKAQDCGLTENKKALKYFDQAFFEYKSKNNKAATELISKSIDEDPDYIEPYWLSIKIHKENRDIKRLVEVYEKISNLCPDVSSEPYYELGNYYYSIYQYSEAISNFEKFQKFIEPDEKKKVEVDKKMGLAKFRLNAYNNPVPFEPQSVPGVCTIADEYLPIISPDDEIIFFTRRYNKESKNSVTDRLVEEFTYSQRKPGELYSKGEKMPPPFNTNNNEGGATVTIDNNVLYFTICKPEGGKINCDIYTSSFRNGKWSEILNMGSKINESFEWDSQPSVAPDGKSLYFASGREGGYGGYDIYKILKDSTGKWGAPINLGSTINTAGNEKSPFLHTDSRTLYFSSDSLIGMGGYDIFYSRQDDNGNWTTPKNIGYPINSEADDLGFFVSTNGATGYFASNKLQGKGGYDIYSFFLYPEARPDKVLFMKGQLKDDAGNPVSGKVEFKDVKTNKTYDAMVDSSTGKYVSALSFKNDFIMTVKQKDVAPVAKYLSKNDTSLNKPVTMDLTVKPIEIGSSFTISNINFSTNSFQLTDTSKLILSGVIDFLTENPSVKLGIYGHTDNVNDDQSNLILSKNRAEAVYNFLVEKGIDKSRLTYKGFGKSKPIASNETEEGRSKNRRTEFVVIEK